MPLFRFSSPSEPDLFQEFLEPEPPSPQRNLIWKRCVAWGLEVSLVLLAGGVPYGVGRLTSSPPTSQVRPGGEMVVRRSPLSWRNPWLWLTGAAAAAMVGGQIYSVARTGQSLPKRWLGLRVITENGQPLTLARAAIREGVGRWGLPVGLAYGIWRFSPAFPHGGVFWGITVFLWLAEAGVILYDQRQRTLHDWLARTLVVETSPALTYSPSTMITSTQGFTWLWETPPWSEDDRPIVKEDGTQTIVLFAQRWRFNLWPWMQRRPGTALAIAGGVTLLSVLGVLISTQLYFQQRLEHLVLKQQRDEMFLALVEQLGRSQGQTPQRQTVILALAQLADDRAIPLLVNLLGQEQNPAVVDTLGSALAQRGMAALPPLLQLNGSLRQEWQTQQDGLTGQRLYACQRAIANILRNADRLPTEVSFSRLHLGQLPNQQAWSLTGLNWAGVNLRGAILAGVDLSQGIFADNDRQGFWVTSDLAGANLKGSKLTEAQLPGISLEQANLMLLQANRTNFQGAKLRGTNLSSAQLISANLSHIEAPESRWTGADLGEAKMTQANLQGSDLGQVHGIGLDLSQANLNRSSWQGSDLSAADLHRANLENSDLSNVVLFQAQLQEVNLQNANLQNADLTAANLRGADLRGANFRNVRLAQMPNNHKDSFLAPIPVENSIASFQGVDFGEVQNLNGDQLKLICDHGGIHPQCTP